MFLIKSTQHLIKKGLFHWENRYTMDKLKKLVNAKKLYCIKNENEIVGCISMANEPSDYYKSLTINFTEVTKPLYFYAFTIKPAYMSIRYVNLFINEMLKFGRKNNYDSIRFDAASNFSKLKLLYLRKGATIIDTIKVDDTYTGDFYEMML